MLHQENLGFVKILFYFFLAMLDLDESGKSSFSHLNSLKVSFICDLAHLTNLDQPNKNLLPLFTTQVHFQDCRLLSVQFLIRGELRRHVSFI